MASDQTYYCSFCGKSQYDVAKLIAGPGNFICNECVDLCHDIVHKPDEPNTLDINRQWLKWQENCQVALANAQNALSSLRQTIILGPEKKVSDKKGEIIGFGDRGECP